MNQPFEFRSLTAPRWFLRVLWLRLMWWAPAKPTTFGKPFPRRWLSVSVRRDRRGIRLHFDIGRVEGYFARL